MNKLCMFCFCAIFVVTMTGCGAARIRPNYTSNNPDLLRIGGEKPTDTAPENINLGSYCLQVTDKWKLDGKTPDDQTIYSKDTFRKAVPCK